MRRSLFAGLAPVLLILLLTACTGGKKKPATPSATAVRSVTANATPALGLRSPTPTVLARGGPAPAVATAAVGRTPSAPSSNAGPGGCQPATQPGIAAPLPPGTPIPRPAIDLSLLSVQPSDVPAGFVPIDAATGFTSAQRLAAADLARGAADPQTELDRLNALGFLGGRQQGWSGVSNQGFVPTLYVQHLVFSSDTGAADFLRSPAIGPQICVKQESGPGIGQETSHLGYQFSQPLTTGGAGMADGHAVFWRCGRLVINVSGAGAPGQISQAQVDQFAQAVQSELVKASQPCA